LKEQHKVNQSQNNFHGANAVQDISSALDNLALAATTDWDIVAQLTQSNKQLTETNKLLSEQLRTSLEANTVLNKKIGNQKQGQTTGPAQPAFDQKTWEANLDPMGYCWSHGYRVLKGHNSANCKGKLGGHKDDSNRTNTKEGSTKGKN
jgi:hypothetical protein